MRRFRFWFPLFLFVLTAGITFGSLAVGGADIAIHFPNGRVVTQHVSFDGSIPATSLLQQSGLKVEMTQNGAVCRIDGVGCPVDNCFCQCTGNGPCLYWAYWRWAAGGWDAYDRGVTQVTITNGMMDGWRWGDGPPTTNNGGSPSLIQPQRGAYAAMDYLRRLQRPDGSFFEGTYGVGLTLDVVLAAAAADVDIDTWRSSTGKSVLDFLITAGPGYLDRGTAREYGKLLAGVVAAEGNPYAFAGHDLVQRTHATYQNGRFGEHNWDQAWAILGLAAAGETIPITATQTLLADATSGGGWGFTPGGSADVDTTGLALQALAAAGAPANHIALAEAKAFLRAQQNDDGGFPVRRPNSSNAPSTAYAILGLIATGENPLAETWRKNGLSPLDRLQAFQGPEGGIEGTAGPNDILATGQAVPALMGKPYPIRGRRVAAERALRWLGAQQMDNGQFSFGAGSTIDALLAIGAAGEDPSIWRRPNGRSPLEYLATQAMTYTQASAGATGKLIVGLHAVGANHRQFGGVDLAARLASFDQGGGAYGNATSQAWSILALRVLGQPTDQAAAKLRAMQVTNGGWSSGFGPIPDTNTTALALQALVAAGEPVSSRTIISATAFLREQQSRQGGFPYQTPDAPDTTSTGNVMLGLMAIRSDPDSLGWTTRLTETTAISVTARTPVDWLLTQQSASGAFLAFGSDSDFATLQIIPALLGKPLPIVTQRLYLPLIEQKRLRP